MSLFRQLHMLPRDAVDIVIDFAYTRDEDNWKRCTYEVLHWPWVGRCYGGLFSLMSPSNYQMLVRLQRTTPTVRDMLGVYTVLPNWWYFRIPCYNRDWEFATRPPPPGLDPTWLPFNPITGDI